MNSKLYLMPEIEDSVLKVIRDFLHSLKGITHAKTCDSLHRNAEKVGKFGCGLDLLEDFLKGTSRIDCS